MHSDFTDLAAELRAKVFFYLSKDALQHLISLPALANYAFNQAFSYVKVAAPQLDPEALQQVGTGVAVEDQQHQSYLLFYSIDHFAQFCTDFPHITVFNRVVLDERAFYTRLVRHFWYLLDNVRRVELSFDIESLYDIEAGRLVHNLAFEKTPSELGLSLRSVYSPKVIPSQFFSSTDLARVTALKLTNIMAWNMEAYFDALQNLNSLELVDTRATDQALSRILPGLQVLKLTNALIVTAARAPFPSTIEQLYLSDIEFHVENFTLDFRYLNDLKKFEVMDNQIVSLNNIKLPGSLKQLSISNPYHTMGDLHLIGQFHDLVSLTIANCKISSVISLLVGHLPKRLKFLKVRYDTDTNALSNSLLTIPGRLLTDIREDHRQAFVTLDKMSPARSLLQMKLELDLIRFNDGFEFPDTIQELTLRTDPNIESPLIKFPSSILCLDLQAINQNTFLKLKLPKRLQSLTIREPSLSCISNPTLVNLHFLRDLNLSNVNLNDESKLFDAIPLCIEDLNLSGNKLSHIHLQKLAKLKRLNLSHSFIASSLNDETMKLPSSLHSLDVGQNHIQNIDTEFRFPIHLQRLVVQTTPDPLNRNAKATTLHFIKDCAKLKSLHAEFHDFRIVNLAELPQSLEKLSLSNGEICLLNNGNMAHLANLVIFEYSGKIEGIKFSLASSLQRLALIDCDIKILSQHIEIPSYLRLAAISIRGSPLLKEEDLASTLARVQQKCSNLCKIEVDHGNLRYPTRERIKQSGIDVLEHPCI